MYINEVMTIRHTAFTLDPRCYHTIATQQAQTTYKMYKIDGLSSAVNSLFGEARLFFLALVWDVSRVFPVNSENVGNVINHRSMNWAQFKDSISHMCLAGAVVV